MATAKTPYCGTAPAAAPRLDLQLKSVVKLKLGSRGGSDAARATVQQVLKDNRMEHSFIGEELAVHLEQNIGGGAFGVVVLATLRGVHQVVAKLALPSDAETLKDLLNEFLRG